MIAPSEGREGKEVGWKEKKIALSRFRPLHPMNCTAFRLLYSRYSPGRIVK